MQTEIRLPPPTQRGDNVDETAKELTRELQRLCQCPYRKENLTNMFPINHGLLNLRSYELE